MTKSFIALIACVLFSCNFLNAQKFIGGSMNFNTNSLYDERQPLTIKQSVVNFHISPSYGKFISEKTAIGIDLNIGLSFSKSESSTNNNSDNKIISYGASPFIRYYFLKFNKASLFVNGKTGFDFSNFRITQNESIYDKPKNYSIYLEAYPGLAYDLNDHFIIQTTLNFIDLRYEYSYSKNISETKKYSNFGIGGGLENILSLNQIMIGALYKF